MSISKGLIRADIIAAKQAIEYYDKKQIKDIKNVAAYHLQQAAEKLLKYQIYKLLDKTDNSKMYTHDLSRLMDYADSQKLDLVVPDYIRKHANMITDWEAGSRYDTGFVVRIDTIKTCYKVIVYWEKIVR